MKAVVRIEGGGYTSLKSAAKYVSRGRAVIICKGDEQVLVFTKSARKKVRSRLTEGDKYPYLGRHLGHFRWIPKPSGGANVMQAVRV